MSNEDKPELLTTIENLPVLDSAVQMLGRVHEIGADEDYHEYATSVNSGDLADIIELLLLFVQTYEGVDIEKMIEIETYNTMPYLKPSGDPN